MDAGEAGWLGAVRAANEAWAAALDAVRDAFPPGSEWRCGVAPALWIIPRPGFGLINTPSGLRSTGPGT